jgi:ABC-type Na+ transport system ATPase subunit NatA
MIEVNHLYHDYEGKGSFAVKDVSFEIARARSSGSSVLAVLVKARSRIF